jgi:proteasome lid subunit RPN8/RPN11
MEAWGASQNREPADRLRIGSDLAGALVEYFHGAGQLERGGVLLGRRDGEDSWIGAAVFPPQLATDMVRCSFNTSSLEVIHAAMAKIVDPEIKRKAGVIIGWIHSHPHHGIFLSRTDRSTLTSWLSLDEKAVAVVVDPFVRGQIDDQIGWWNSPSVPRRITCEKPPPDFIRIEQTAAMAQAISDTAQPNSVWDVITSRCIIKLLASSPDSGPA